MSDAAAAELAARLRTRAAELEQPPVYDDDAADAALLREAADQLDTPLTEPEQSMAAPRGGDHATAPSGSVSGGRETTRDD